MRSGRGSRLPHGDCCPRRARRGRWLWACYGAFCPVGLFTSALLLAATSVRALDGALLMFAFGLGTLPAMLMTGLGIAGFATLLQHRQARLGLGLAIIILGLASVISPAVLLFQTPEHH